jgi:hypothetical protein
MKDIDKKTTKLPNIPTKLMTVFTITSICGIILVPLSIIRIILSIMALIKTNNKKYRNSKDYVFLMVAGVIGIIGIPIVDTILFFMAYKKSETNNMIIF